MMLYGSYYIPVNVPCSAYTDGALSEFSVFSLLPILPLRVSLRVNLHRPRHFFFIAFKVSSF